MNERVNFENTLFKFKSISLSKQINDSYNNNSKEKKINMKEKERRSKMVKWINFCENLSLWMVDFKDFCRIN